MKNLDERIKKVLESRGIVTEKQIEEYFSPSISFLKDPFLLSGMKTAVERIKQAIDNHECVVIYGDYDTDGVSASAILYLYLKKCGLEPHVFIPNRFEDGYGLSQETIEYISENLFPDLVITVDCGITAIEEVELLTDLGIDVIVTDHHIPQEILPNAVAVIDPKIASEYGFDGLCGAGVVLKLVQALGGKIEDYLDIAALATIGDIVPLVDENRVIASLGLKKINSPSCNKGIKALKNLVAPGVVLTSQDVSFKLVPRVNSTGRMRDSILSFNLLVAQSDAEAENLAAEIDKVNSERMNVINDSMIAITKTVREQNLNEKSAIVVRSKDFHLGVLGILASRLVGEYNLPAFVFHEDENGFLKGSCRSVGELDIHQTLMPLSHLCESIGGHKMAAGLSIKKENYQQFETELQILLKDKFVAPVAQEPKYDILVEDTDLTLNFAKQIAALEPCGCGNEMPVLCMQVNGAEFKQTSSPKHYQLITKNKKYLICFSGEKYSNCFGQKDTKVYLGLSIEKYNNEYRVKSVIKDVYAPKILKAEENVSLCAISDYLNQNTEANEIVYKENETQLLNVAKNLVKESGTLVIARSLEQFNRAVKELNIEGKYYVPTNQQCVVVYAPGGVFAKENIARYKNVVLLSGSISKYGELRGVNYYSYPFMLSEISKDRKVFADCFRVFEAAGKVVKNNLFEYVNHVSKHLPYSKEQIGYCLAVFVELGIISPQDAQGNFSPTVNKNIKRKLDESKLYNMCK